MYKLCWVTLNVLNVERSVAFYNGLLGLPVSSKSESHDTSLAMKTLQRWKSYPTRALL